MPIECWSVGGPGKFDAELNLDGKAFRPDGRAATTLIPPAFGMAGVNLHTWGGGWGTVTYWNAYVANLELNGQGNFYDARLNNAEQMISRLTGRLTKLIAQPRYADSSRTGRAASTTTVVS